jgi:hypothetical protein
MMGRGGNRRHVIKTSLMISGRVLKYKNSWLPFSVWSWLHPNSPSQNASDESALTGPLVAL